MAYNNILNIDKRSMGSLETQPQVWLMLQTPGGWWHSIDDVTLRKRGGGGEDGEVGKLRPPTNQEVVFLPPFHQGHLCFSLFILLLLFVPSCWCHRNNGQFTRRTSSFLSCFSSSPIHHIPFSIVWRASRLALYT